MIAGKVLMDRNAPAALLDTAQARLRRIEGADRALARSRPRSSTRSRRASPAPARPRSSRRPARCGASIPDAWLQSHVAENRAEIAWVARALSRARATISTSTTTTACSGARAVFGARHPSRRSRAARAATRPARRSRTARPRTCSSAAACSRIGAREARAPAGARRPRHRRRRRHQLLACSRTMQRGLRGRAAAAARRCRRRTPSISRRAAARDALDLDDRIGSIAPGCEADLVVLDLALDAADRLPHGLLHDLDEAALRASSCSATTARRWPRTRRRAPLRAGPRAVSRAPGIDLAPLATWLARVGPVAIVDLETTGLPNEAASRIVEFAALLLDPGSDRIESRRDAARSRHADPARHPAPHRHHRRDRRGRAVARIDARDAAHGAARSRDRRAQCRLRAPLPVALDRRRARELLLSRHPGSPRRHASRRAGPAPRNLHAPALRDRGTTSRPRRRGRHAPRDGANRLRARAGEPRYAAARAALANYAPDSPWIPYSRATATRATRPKRAPSSRSVSAASRSSSSTKRRSPPCCATPSAARAISPAIACATSRWSSRSASRACWSTAVACSSKAARASGSRSRISRRRSRSRCAKPRRRARRESARVRC